MVNPISIGILGGSAILGGILQSSAAKKAREEQLRQQNYANQLQMSKERFGQLQSEQQGSLSDLISAYRSGLVGE